MELILSNQDFVKELNEKLTKDELMSLVLSNQYIYVSGRPTFFTGEC